MALQIPPPPPPEQPTTRSTTPTTPKRPRPRLSPRSLAGRSVSRYLNEPPRLGNTLVALPSGTKDVSAATMSHEERVVDELAKLTLKLP